MVNGGAAVLVNLQILGRGRISVEGKEWDLMVTTHSFKPGSLRGSEELK